MAVMKEVEEETEIDFDTRIDRERGERDRESERERSLCLRRRRRLLLLLRSDRVVVLVDLRCECVAPHRIRVFRLVLEALLQLLSHLQPNISPTEPSPASTFNLEPTQPALTLSSCQKCSRSRWSSQPYLDHHDPPSRNCCQQRDGQVTTDETRCCDDDLVIDDCWHRSTATTTTTTTTTKGRGNQGDGTTRPKRHCCRDGRWHQHHKRPCRCSPRSCIGTSSFARCVFGRWHFSAQNSTDGWFCRTHAGVSFRCSVSS